ncbi:hypothetical protein [Leptothoe spongobia]|uniref:hypothetical protein n=1 Tax=Leptothoe spongobia TaxID=2651728 RepID=UPI001C0358D0|nr:hypothetical protein [Leptothoe spongobia]
MISFATLLENLGKDLVLLIETPCTQVEQTSSLDPDTLVRQEAVRRAIACRCSDTFEPHILNHVTH